eukprot:scaffold1415_cov152-Skeletonema_menzelii.AAC.11
MTKILPPTNRRLLVSLLLTGLAGNNNIVEAVVPSSQLRRVAGIKEQLPDDHFDRRNLQVDCSSISRSRDCGNTSGCQWAGKNNGGCIAVQTSPPSPEPTPAPTPLPTVGSTPQPTPAPTEALNDGPPKSLRIDQIEVDPIETPMVLAIPYDSGTSFSITAHAAWCSGQCTETFISVNSVDHVRASQGNTYYFDAATKLLYVRIIQTPQTYLTPWKLWKLDDLNASGDPRTHALDRFTFSGITLPSFAHGPYLQIEADCAEGAITGHCATTPSYIEPEVCPSGYIQVSYDKCCVSEGSSDCYDPTVPPTSAPTPQPTFGQGDNLVLNPGFESGETNWYSNYGSGFLQIDTDQAHSGTQSILATGRTSTWNGPEQDMRGRMSGNKTYRISCWAKLKGATSSDNLKLTLRIDDDVGGRQWKGVSSTINNQDWTLVQGDIAVNVDGTLTDIRLYAEGPAVNVEFYVDDVSAIEVSKRRSLASVRSSTQHEDVEMQAASGIVASPMLSLLAAAVASMFLWHQ